MRGLNVLNDVKLGIILRDAYVEEILPTLRKEINNGPLFVPLRQIYHALALATFVRRHLESKPNLKQFFDVNRPYLYDLHRMST